MARREGQHLAVCTGGITLHPGSDIECVGACANFVGPGRGARRRRVGEARVNVADGEGVAIVAAAEWVAGEGRCDGEGLRLGGERGIAGADRDCAAAK